MAITDDGKWQQVDRRAYFAFLRTHPNRSRLRRAMWDQGERGKMWYVFDSEAFEADSRESASTHSHMVALRVEWLVSDGGDGRMRFWIPADQPDATTNAD